LQLSWRKVCLGLPGSLPERGEGVRRGPVFNRRYEMTVVTDEDAA
jgi:hypothetical protein